MSILLDRLSLNYSWKYWNFRKNWDENRHLSGIERWSVGKVTLISQIISWNGCDTVSSVFDKIKTWIVKISVSSSKLIRSSANMDNLYKVTCFMTQNFAKALAVVCYYPRQSGRNIIVLVSSVLSVRLSVLPSLRSHILST